MPYQKAQTPRTTPSRSAAKTIGRACLSLSRRIPSYNRSHGQGQGAGARQARKERPKHPSGRWRAGASGNRMDQRVDTESCDRVRSKNAYYQQQQQPVIASVLLHLRSFRPLHSTSRFLQLTPVKERQHTTGGLARRRPRKSQSRTHSQSPIHLSVRSAAVMSTKERRPLCSQEPPAKLNSCQW
jgi:hypothetical protein